MKTCRGVGASLSERDIAKWEIEHHNLLNKIAPESFNVLHYVAMTVLKVKKRMKQSCKSSEVIALKM